MGESDTFKEVTKEEFYIYMGGRWYTTHPGFFKDSVRFVIDGDIVGYRMEETYKIKFRG